MPKLHPVVERLRDASIQAADDMINAGRVTTLREAALIVWRRSRQRHTQTGFSTTNEKKFVDNFYRWYRRRRSTKPMRSQSAVALDEWLADDYE